ncbi:2-oxo-tetronate isomerase [Oceanimonas doudoroffii]|uniref:Hydroxypyruvate isomerase n=1 Tax=Oceanimonas doudoroffii TaxID=84158 RepID=A0A233RD10_9GAMM|nr:2-oxo-tetronate isomerase [Oceanimonas doudoroffii]OXY81284.1 hydroxypyruvate isomerase [Oceanimonas doudoroffii]
MPKFAANLSMMFTEVPFLARFKAARAAGFTAVEYLFPYAEDKAAIAAELKAQGLTQALFNMPPGDWEAGERGLASLPGRESEFRAGVATALAYAEALGCRQLHAMAGLRQAGVSAEQHEATYVANIQYAADQAAKQDVLVLLEPINSRDMPGYFLSTQVQAEALLEKIDRPNVRIQLDFYHCQIMEGDLTRTIDRLWGKFSHIQIASVPERHEPDQGEINYPWLFDYLDAKGYDGYLGCEYRPRGNTEAGLGWFAPWADKE